MNIAINLLKWPVISWLALLAWFAVRELAGAFKEIVLLPDVAMPVFMGIALYAALWLALLRKSSTAATITTLEHEAAHLLASIATFNSVKGIEARDSGEGHVRLVGKGNWIIAVAPYVAPVALLIPYLLLRASNEGESLPRLLFGVAIGYHIHSTWTETHSRQPDLKELGLLGTWILLPACHVLVTTWVCGLLLGNQHHLYTATRLACQAVTTALDPSGAAKTAMKTARRVSSISKQLWSQGI